MKTAERMRRDGWQHLISDMWIRWMHGRTFVLYSDGGRDSPSGFSVNPYCDDGLDYGFDVRHGLRDLAQRAKATARKLARRKR